MLTDLEAATHGQELYNYSIKIMDLDSHEAVLCLSIAIGMIVKDSIKDHKTLENVLVEIQKTILRSMIGVK